MVEVKKGVSLSLDEEENLIKILFDEEWYKSQINGQIEENIDYVKHYILYGSKEGKQPLAAFDPEWYLRHCPDSASSQLSPLAHYLLEGDINGFDPHPLFSSAWYRDQGDVKDSNPLVDFLRNPENWRRSPHPLFDSAWYLQQYNDVVLHQLNPFRHFLQSGARELRNPCPLFNTRWYVEHNAGVDFSIRNPLIDYVDRIDFKNINPNPFFYSDWYLSNNGDVAASGINPLVHYITAGWQEGRDPSPYFDAAWYCSKYPNVEYSRIDPLTHYICLGGLQAGYLPRPIDKHINDCDAIEIPFEIFRFPGSLYDRDVCLFVCYAAEGNVEDYVVSYLKSFYEKGFAIILVIVTEGMNNEVSSDLDFVDGILVRINHGWDFAAWGTALAVFPDLWYAKLLILANDSVYGPNNIQEFSKIIEFCRNSDKNIISLTDSYQVQHHLMSYFTAITSSGLKNKAIKNFWNGIRSNRDKNTVIHEYEIRSIERWVREGVTWEVIYPTIPNSDLPINPTLEGWKELSGRGFPFVKVQLLRDFLDKFGAEEALDIFHNNEVLAHQIKHDLERRRISSHVSSRPIPTPKQKFIQNDSLITYYGATTSVRPSNEVDLALEVPIRNFHKQQLNLPEQVAVVMHVFYPDLLPELLSYIDNIPIKADIFISTDSNKKREQILDIGNNYFNGKFEVRVFPNRGRDIAPLIIGFTDVFDKYEIMLHIHTKKSLHDSAFAEWRQFLLNNLLGSTEIVSSILHILNVHDVGIIFSQHFQAVRNLLNFGYNYENMRELLGRCNIDLTKNMVLEFPSSSFFWMRTDAIRPLLQLHLDWSDFPDEAGQVDGTLAHAIERSLLYVSERVGLRWVKVGHQQHVPVEMLVPIHGTDSIDKVISQAHRPLLRNKILTYKENSLIPEVNRIFSRKDNNEKMRLTILVPTLQPIKIFGGLTTALRFFDGLSKEFNKNIDLRIVSISERVDLESMSSFSDYRLVQISSTRDEYSRVIVDASEKQRGYLGVRKNEIFIATAWWTANCAYELQKDQELMFKSKIPIIYLVQDHESHFYPWSTRYGKVEQTYLQSKDAIVILNSEELANFYTKKYRTKLSRVLPFSLNPSIMSKLSYQPRERIILIYGRPTVGRNCFEEICQVLRLWQRSEPVMARRWRILSLGEDYNSRIYPHIENLEVLGKVSLEDYGMLLSKASVGISLMLSPHPSYPPLEMAYAGLITITNGYENKDLSLRSPNIVSIDCLDADKIALALSDAVHKAEGFIGQELHSIPLSDIECDVKNYSSSELAEIIYSIIEP